jgi:error-prone DNA polymerase
MDGAYAELQCRSHFSFLRGGSHPRELVERAAALGYQALALTDQDGVHGVVRALEAAEEVRLALIVGSHLTVEDPHSGALGVPLVVLAQDLPGYQNLSHLLTIGRTAAAKGESRLTFEQVAQRSAGLIALYVGEPNLHTVGDWREVFGDRLYLGVSRHLIAGEERRNRGVDAIGAMLGVPRVALGDVHTHHPRRQALQDVLTCIRHKCTLSEAADRLFPNAERTLRPLSTLQALFRDRPEWLARTVEVAQRCTFSLRELVYRFPDATIPPGQTAARYLRTLVERGLDARYGGEVPEDVRAQVSHELALIERLQFEGYFLTVWDIVRFARSQGILCQGRGSAANSAVCYALGITAIDPVRMDLLFERFISEERGEPPDIDVDFEHERREEVLQYVYQRYGRDRAAMVCEVICYRGRLALREVGKVFGLSADQLERLAKAVGYSGVAEVSDEVLVEVGLNPADPTVRSVLRLAYELEDTPRHLSIHVGGFVITRDPIHALVPVENAAMEGRTVVQWDKDDIDTLGILKVDLLALGMLTCVAKAFQLIAEHQKIPIGLDTIPLEDGAVYDRLCAGDSLGVFQVESRAQMGMLPRLRPRSFYDLVVEVAIVRPGPIQGDMVHPYLRRRQGQERVEFPHPAVQRVLGRTYGVPLFQEQVMKLAVVVGGFTPGEADELRRAMGAWRRRGRMTELAGRLIRGLMANGVEEKYAQRIFEQIHGFGEYGFPESHAASFALIVYASAYLRTHHRAAFACALLNSQPMGFYAPHSIVADAQRSRVTVLGVDIFRSEWDCTLERLPEDRPDRDGPPPLALRLGFRMVRGLARDVGHRIAALRALAAPIQSIGALQRHTGIRVDQLLRLAAAGAFSAFGASTREAIWQVQGLAYAGLPLLDGLSAPPDAAALPPMSPHEAMLTDYSALGLSLGYHPVGVMREELERRGIPSAEQLRELPTGKRLTVAGLVIVRQRPETAKGTLFITLEDETGHINVIVWPKILQRYRLAARDEVLIEVDGEIQREAGVVNIVASALRKLTVFAPPAEARSRDFR